MDKPYYFIAEMIINDERKEFLDIIFSQYEKVNNYSNILFECLDYKEIEKRFLDEKD